MLDFLASLPWSVLGVVFGTVFLAEMGDKTQLLMIAMAKKYRIRDILLGVGLAVIVLNAAAVGLGILIGGILPTMAINLIAGVAFFWFATSAILSDDEDENVASRHKVPGWIATFGIFFLGELGDKTQLTTLALAADRADGADLLSVALMAFLGSTLALYAADSIGLLIGACFGKKIPNAVFAWLSYVLFAVFGVTKLLDGFAEVFDGNEKAMLWRILCTVAASLIFLGVSMFLRFRKKTEA